MCGKVAFSVLIAFTVAVTLDVSPVVAAGISDNFEDGNWTANPTWVDTNPGNGLATISPDPVRPNNLVWQAMGQQGASRTIATNSFDPMPWAGFHASIEIFRPDTAVYTGSLFVYDDLQAKTQGMAQGFQLSFDEGRSAPGVATLKLYESNPTGWVPRSIVWNQAEVGTNEWLQVNLWSDPTSGRVKADVRRLSDGHVYIEDSIVPMSFGDSPLRYLEIGAGTSPYWNYFDNPTLTPEPASLAFLAIGSLAVIRRRSVR